MFGRVLVADTPFGGGRRMFNIVMVPVIVSIMVPVVVLNMMAIVVGVGTVDVVAVITVIAVIAAVRHSRPAVANATLVAATGRRRLSAPAPRVYSDQPLRLMHPPRAARGPNTAAAVVLITGLTGVIEDGSAEPR